MKKQLIFLSLVMTGFLSASVNDGDKVVQAPEAPKAPEASKAEVVASKAPEASKAEVVAPKAPEAPKAPNTVPAPAPVAADKEAVVISRIDQLKALAIAGLGLAKKAGSTVKHYLLADFIAEWLHNNKYADVNKSLISFSPVMINGHRLINWAAVVALVNIAYFSYKAVVSEDADEDLEDEDFLIEDEE